MDYLNDIKPFEDLGKTDEWIAELLDGLTAIDITAEMLYIFSREEDLWINSPDGITGALQTAWEDPNNDTPLLTKKVLAEVYSIIFDSAADLLFTTVVLKPNGNPKGNQPARNLFLTLGRLLTNGDITQQQIDGLYDLVGGRIHAGVVEADVTASRVAYDAQVAQDAADAAAAQAEQDRQQSIQSFWATLENDIINPSISDGTSTVDDIKPLIEAAVQ